MTHTPEKIILLEFGHKVRHFRKIISISQEELASRAGVHRTYIGMIERGEKNITIISMIKISKALGIDAYKLLKDDSNGQ